MIKEMKGNTMIKEIHGWKVINKKTRASACAGHWQDHKTRRITNWSIIYTVDVVIKAKVRGSKLFFFESYDDAKRFNHNPRNMIVPCVATNAVPVKYIGKNISHIRDFWKKRSKSKYKKLAPRGTWLAESIRCLS